MVGITQYYIYPSQRVLLKFKLLVSLTCLNPLYLGQTWFFPFFTGFSALIPAWASTSQSSVHFPPSWDTNHDKSSDRCDFPFPSRDLHPPPAYSSLLKFTSGQLYSVVFILNIGCCKLGQITQNQKKILNLINFT